ncbi:hypothetical protein ZWY2020_005543 [Hordeum vulgare]|nr:hypothetical protein ZWY2020_005543 [Hordeum vulgare]
MATAMAMSSLAGAAVLKRAARLAASAPGLCQRWGRRALVGESAEGRAGAIMNANAELWNGCFAMLGLVALAATEIITGAPFINV